MKKIIALILVLMMIVPMFTVMTSADGGTTSWDFEKLENTEGYEAITTEEQLKAIKPGGKYYLANDITLTEAYSAPDLNCYKTNGVCKDGTHTGDYACGITLHGNGYTIDIGTYNGYVFNTLPQGSDISNLTVKGDITSTGGNTAGLAFKINGGYIHNIISNVNITDSDLSKDTEGTRVAGIVGGAWRSAITIENCINNGDITVSRSGSAMGVAGIFGYATGNIVPVTIINCVNNGNITNVSDKSTGYAGGIAGNVRSTVLSITNCTNNGTVTAVMADQISAYKAPTEASGNLENGFALKFGEATVDKDYTDGSITLPDGSVFEFDTLTAEEIEEGGYIAVSTAAQFAAMTKDNKYYLTNDIDLTEASDGFDPTTFAPLNPRDYNSTAGDHSITLHGNGYTVKTNVPLFANLGRNSVISDLKVEGTIKGLYNFVTSDITNSWMESGRTTGAIAGVIRGSTIRNILNYAVIDATEDAAGNAITANANYMVGGIVGGAYSTAGGSIENCVNFASVKGATLSAGGVGGILGRDNATVTVKNCVNIGAVANTASDTAYAGGIFGNATVASTIIDCVNTGVVETATALGGVLGCSKNATLINVKNTADLSDSSSYMGGIVGYATGNMPIYSSFNAGSVNNTSGTSGGIIGYVDAGNQIIVYNCTNSVTGTITGKTNAGGIVPYVNATATVIFDGCKNYAKVNGSNVTGGIVGDATVKGAFSFSECENHGKVTTQNKIYTGGIVGKINAGSTALNFTKCVNNADVTAEGAANEASAGGLVGYIVSTSASFTKCINHGAVKGGGRAGGILAYANNATASNSTFNDCENYGTISCLSSGVSGAYAGGIIAAGSYVNATGCYNNGSVTGFLAAGGIVGIATKTGAIKYCLNAGNITTNTSTVATMARNGAAGIFGCADAKSNIQYCGSVGKVMNNNDRKGTNCTGSAGIAMSKVSTTTVSDCFVTVAPAVVEGAATVVVYDVSNATVSDCYVLGENLTDKQLSGGYLAYIMQNASTAAANTWGQDLSAEGDDYPVLNGDEVYLHKDKYYNASVIAERNLALHHNFKYQIYAITPEAAKVVFTMNGVDTEVEGEAVEGSDAYVYVFDGIAPQFIATDITATLYVDGEAVDTRTESILDYCEALYEYKDATDKDKAIVEKVYLYGKAARDYVVDAKNLYTEVQLPAVTSEIFKDAVTGEVSGYNNAIISGEANGASFYSANVFFDSTNSIVLKVKLNGADYTKVAVNGVAVSAPVDGVSTVTFEDIKASKYAEATEYALTVDGVAGQTLTYSVSIYAQRMVNKDGASDEMKALAAATYEYGAAAAAYAAN